MSLEIVEFKPCIVALTGPPLSGKTALGLEVSHETNLRFIDINPERWLFPQDGGEFRSPLVRSMAMAETYALAHFRAAQHLAVGEPVLLAATYSHGSYVNMLREFADLYRRVNALPEATLKIFVLQAPEESLAEREEARRRMGDEKLFPYIPLETAIDLRGRFVPIKGNDTVHINTGLPIEENVAQILAELAPFRG